MTMPHNSITTRRLAFTTTASLALGVYHIQPVFSFNQKLLYELAFETYRLCYGRYRYDPALQEDVVDHIVEGFTFENAVAEQVMNHIDNYTSELSKKLQEETGVEPEVCDHKFSPDLYTFD